MEERFWYPLLWGYDTVALWCDGEMLVPFAVGDYAIVLWCRGMMLLVFGVGGQCCCPMMCVWERCCYSLT